MKSFTIAAILSFSVFVAAQPPFDPAGAPHIGVIGAQFIGGQCTSDANCASGCCAKPTGICSGPGASTQAGKQGCGFGGALPAGNTAASTTPANGGPPFDPNGAHLVGNQAHQQFITGQCINDADCASGCCAGPSGICSGPGASTQNGKTGCAFPNARVDAPAFFGAVTADSSAADTVVSAGVEAVPANGGPPFDPAGAKNVGQDNAQFIGGQCFSDSNCVSGCCAKPSGICSGVGAQTQNGKQGCGFVSAKRLLFF